MLRQQLSSSSSCKFLRRFFQKARRGMGSCFSVTPSSSAAAGGGAGWTPTTKVIAPDGSLTEYSWPIRVCHILLTTPYISSFICDSDQLFYGARIQALDSSHLLRPGNIYFMLPRNNLSHPLTADGMAALAARANVALAKAAPKKKSRCSGRKGTQISLVTAEEFDGYERLNEKCVVGSSVTQVSPVIEGETVNEDDDNAGAGK